MTQPFHSTFSVRPAQKFSSVCRPGFLIAFLIVTLCLAGYVFLPAATSHLMLSVIEWKAKVKIEYEKRQTRGFFWVRYGALSVARTETVRVEAREVIVQYNIFDLLRKRLDLEIYAQGIQVHSTVPYKGKSLVESFEFDDLESTFTLASQKRIKIDHLILSGSMGSIFLAGRLQEKRDLDLRFVCFLSQDFLARLPQFIRENLFRENELPLKHFRFGLNGNWQQPSINFHSDLLEFNFTRKG